jgi:ClpP class serine protease
VNTQACSAAYWLASQADEVVCTPSGEAGSVGVYMMHVSYAGMNEQMGIEPTFVKVPPGKTDGNPEEPLSESGKAQWQQDVEDIYAMFVGDVAKGRGVSAEAVMANYGKGHTLLAARAEEAGIVDRIATLDEVVAELFGTPAQEGEAMSALAMRVSARLAEGTERLLAVGGDDDEDEDELDEDEDVPPGDDEDDDDDDEDEQKPVVDDVEGEPQAANPAQGKCSLCGKYVESGTVCGGCKGSQTAEAAETAAFLASL